MRCQALTIHHEQCKREAEPGSDYCWQHQGYNQKSASKSKSPKSLSPRSPKGSVDEKSFARFAKQKTSRHEEEKEHKIVLKGPLTLNVESVNYIKLPFQIHLGAGNYSYNQVIEVAGATFRKELTHQKLKELIKNEQSFLGGSPTTVKRSTEGMQYYQWLLDHYDPNNAAGIIHSITGPDRNGKYYLRLKSDRS